MYLYTNIPQIWGSIKLSTHQNESNFNKNTIQIQMNPISTKIQSNFNIIKMNPTSTKIQSKFNPTSTYKLQPKLNQTSTK